MVKLTKVTATKKKTLLNKKRWAGVWDNKEGRLIEKYALELRKTGKIVSF